MPLALSTRFTTWVSLPLEADLPEAERPAFQVRFLTCEQSRQITEALNRDHCTWEEWRAGIETRIREVLVGWRNMAEESPVEGTVPKVLGFNPDKLRTMLTDGELRDLALAIMEQTRLGYEELKKSKSPPASAPGSSPAPAATPAGS